jgi:hypothetical protein
LPSEEALTKAGVRVGVVKRRMVEEYVMGHGEIDFDQNHYAHLSTVAVHCLLFSMLTEIKATSAAVSRHSG